MWLLGYRGTRSISEEEFLYYKLPDCTAFTYALLHPALLHLPLISKRTKQGRARVTVLADLWLCEAQRPRLRCSDSLQRTALVLYFHQGAAVWIQGSLAVRDGRLHSRSAEPTSCFRESPMNRVIVCTFIHREPVCGNTSPAAQYGESKHLSLEHHT